MSELVDLGRNLQSLQQHSLLTLDADVLGPLDHTSNVHLGLDVVADLEVARILREEGGIFAGILFASSR